MDQLISNLLAILPKSTTTAPTLQRYATIFGRFLERLYAQSSLAVSLRDEKFVQYV